MSYTKTNWENGATPAINADNLNKIEQGIADCMCFIDPTDVAASFEVQVGAAASIAEYSYTATKDCMLFCSIKYAVGSSTSICKIQLNLVDLFTVDTTGSGFRENYMIPVKAGQTVKFVPLVSKITVIGNAYGLA